jgi:hypothetical protein
MSAKMVERKAPPGDRPWRRFVPRGVEKRGSSDIPVAPQQQQEQEQKLKRGHF